MMSPIKSFIVRFADGTRRKIEVGDGEGFFREELISGSEKSISTYQCFVAGGSWRELPVKEA